MFILMILWNQILSSLVAVSNDFEQLYKALVQVLFYSMPIIWSMEVISPYPLATKIVNLNPFVYIIQGFRDSFTTGALPNNDVTLYFWVLCLVLFVFGAILQFRLRRHYVDLI